MFKVNWQFLKNKWKQYYNKILSIVIYTSLIDACSKFVAIVAKCSGTFGLEAM